MEQNPNKVSEDNKKKLLNIIDSKVQDLVTNNLVAEEVACSDWVDENGKTKTIQLAIFDFDFWKKTVVPILNRISEKVNDPNSN